METEEIIYQNKWCKVVAKGTIYILKSKKEKYNDQYFTTLDEMRSKTGIPPNPKFSEV